MSEAPKAYCVVIDSLRADDMPAVEVIVRHWVRKDGAVIEEEAAAALVTVRGGLDEASGRSYLVARDGDGKVLGVMGFGPLPERMAPYRTDPSRRAAGLLTAFLSPEARGRGVGKRLLTALFEKARGEGFSEMIWSSNPRYRETAWSFYSALAGDPVGLIEGLFFPTSVSPVWRKSLLPRP